MRIKLGKDFRYSFTIVLALLVAMQLEVNRMILLLTICLLLYLSGRAIHGVEPIGSLAKLKKICRYEALIIFLFTIIQVMVLGLGVRGIVGDLGIISCIYIGIICGAISMKQYRSFETYLNAILMFLIVFSLYYILEIVLHGLPEGRGSAIGNVSSNYCAAILYLNYPVVLYYLFARGEKIKNDKKIVHICYFAIVLSLVVIASSGSRTAIGAVALMAVQMVLFKQKSMKNKIRVIAVLVTFLLALLIAYRFNQSVHELMDRALDAFGGKSTLDSNVRQLIWAAGIQQFKSGNVFFGLGTSIVTKFERSAHNLFYEVLMSTGYIGTVMFFLIFGIALIFIFKNQKYQQRFFTVMILVAVLITCFVQPFFSTSYTCGMMLWMSLFALTADTERRLL